MESQFSLEEIQQAVTMKWKIKRRFRHTIGGAGQPTFPFPPLLARKETVLLMQTVEIQRTSSCFPVYLIMPPLTDIKVPFCLGSTKETVWMRWSLRNCILDSWNLWILEDRHKRNIDPGCRDSRFWPGFDHHAKDSLWKPTFQVLARLAVHCRQSIETVKNKIHP